MKIKLLSTKFMTYTDHAYALNTTYTCVKVTRLA